MIRRFDILVVVCLNELSIADDFIPIEPRPLFIKQQDVLLPDIVKSRSREIQV